MLYHSPVMDKPGLENQDTVEDLYEGDSEIVPHHS